MIGCVGYPTTPASKGARWEEPYRVLCHVFIAQIRKNRNKKLTVLQEWLMPTAPVSSFVVLLIVGVYVGVLGNYYVCIRRFDNHL